MTRMSISYAVLTIDFALALTQKPLGDLLMSFRTFCEMVTLMISVLLQILDSFLQVCIHIYTYIYVVCSFLYSYLVYMT